MATLIAAARPTRKQVDPGSFRCALPDDRQDEPRTKSRRRRTDSQPPRCGGRARRRVAGASATGGAKDGTTDNANRHALRGPGGEFCRKDGGATAQLTPPRAGTEAAPLIGPALLPAREGVGVPAPTHRPPAAVPPTQGGRGGRATVGRPRPGEHGYKFVNFLHEYSERPLDLPSQLDKDRPRLTAKRRAHVFTLQLLRARAFHSGLVPTWHAAIPFVQSTGEQLREGDIYLSWIPV